MTQKIWSIEYIRENPEIAAKAIETLQTALDDTEAQLQRTKTALEEISQCLAKEKKEM